MCVTKFPSTHFVFESQNNLECKGKYNKSTLTFLLYLKWFSDSNFSQFFLDYMFLLLYISMLADKYFQ